MRQLIGHGDHTDGENIRTTEDRVDDAETTIDEPGA